MNAPNPSGFTATSREMLPPVEIRSCTHDICARRGRVRRVIAKLGKAMKFEIPIGYEDATGFHLGPEHDEQELKQESHYENK
jgi:hypothetical protein